MFEESASSIPSIWASMNSWFAHAVLFVLLNVMIGTIYFTSSLANQKNQPQQTSEDDDTEQQPQQNNTLSRSPSVLQRLRSINLSSYRSPEPHPSPLSTAPIDPTRDLNTDFAAEQTHPETETQIDFQETQFGEEVEEVEEERSLDEVYSELKDRHVDRTLSDTNPASGEMPEKLPTKMRKSASAKSAFAHFEKEDVVEVEARRPATVREGRASSGEADEEVDAKADDFINKFKQQLKLQRLDSFIRYKDMISRGSAK